MVLGVRCDVDIIKLTASAQSIYREVYDPAIITHQSHTIEHAVQQDLSIQNWVRYESSAAL